MTDIADPFADEIDEETKALATVDRSFNPEESAILFSSINPTTRTAQIKLYNVVSGNTAALADMIGNSIFVQDVIAHKTRMVDQNTGVVSDLIRTILITPEGDGYSAVSDGVNNCLKKLFGLLGPPPWSPALELQPFQTRTSSNRQVLLLRAVDTNEEE